MCIGHWFENCGVSGVGVGVGVGVAAVAAVASIAVPLPKQNGWHTGFSTCVSKTAEQVRERESVLAATVEELCHLRSKLVEVPLENVNEDTYTADKYIRWPGASAET